MKKKTLRPVVHGKMAGQDYYVGVMTLGEMAETVRPPGEMPGYTGAPARDEGVRERTARALLQGEKPFWPPVVLGVAGGEPTWLEIEVQDNPLLTEGDTDAAETRTLGLLEMDGTETVYALSGAEAAAGIRDALEAADREGLGERLEALLREELPVVFVSASPEGPGREGRLARALRGLSMETGQGESRTRDTQQR